MQRSSNGPYSSIFWVQNSVSDETFSIAYYCSISMYQYFWQFKRHSSIQLQGACTFDKIYETLPMCIHSLTSRLEVLRITWNIYYPIPKFNLISTIALLLRKFKTFSIHPRKPGSTWIDPKIPYSSQIRNTVGLSPKCCLTMPLKYIAFQLAT